MASEVIQALFTARETISSSLESIERSTQSLDAVFTSLQTQLANVSVQGEATEGAVDSLDNSLKEISTGAAVTERGLEQVENAMESIITSEEVTEQQMDSLTRALRNVYGGAQIAEQGITETSNALIRARASGDITEDAFEKLNDELQRAAASSTASSQSLTALTSTMGALWAASKRTEESAERVNDQLGQMTARAASASGSMGLLQTMAASTSLSFSSLSVNIGPFNIALRNFLVQLPAILTGMGSMLALATALATAFFTMAAGLGAIIGGGALAFWEDFSRQFEESADAVEALMGALKDLFSEALEPLTTDANMDAFVNAINWAAQTINQWAQFFAQMRDEIIGFLDGIGGDTSELFEALHDSFVMMTPILQDFINFFVEGFPPILMTFTKLTVAMSDDIGILVDAFGNLFMEMLSVANLVIEGIAPVLSALVNHLAGVFHWINNLNSSFVTATVFGLALALVFARMVFSLIRLYTALQTVYGAMVAQTVAGSSLSAMFVAQIGLLKALAAGNITHAQAVQLSIASLKRHILATWASVKAMAAQKAAALSNLLGISALTSGISLWGAATWATTAATTALTAALGVLLSPVGLVIGAIAALVGVLAMMGRLDVFDPIIEKAKALLGWIMDLVDGFMEFISLGGDAADKARKGMADPTKTDDIQTQPNVNLSFEDNLEQNMDVTADPEEKEQMRRVVKDAMNEANSIARRTQGSGR